MKKLKCSKCKKFKIEIEFPTRKKQINKTRGYTDYICKSCHNDLQIIKIAKKKGIEYMKEKRERYKELAALYEKEIKKTE